MEISSGLIIAGIIGLIAGIVIIRLINKNKSLSLLSDAKKEAEKIIESAKDKGESIKNNKILQAKEKFLELKSEHEKIQELISSKGRLFTMKIGFFIQYAIVTSP